MESSTHALVLMAPRVDFDQFPVIDQLLSQLGIDRDLPRALPVPRSLQAQRSCWAVNLTQVSDATLLRSRLDSLGDELGVDLVVQSHSVRHANYRLAVFDMDSTLIECEVIDELAARHGVGDQVARITERAMRGEIDFNQSFAERLGMLRGLHDEVVADIAESLPITEGMPELVKTLRARGVYTAILSGGFRPFAEHLQRTYGFDRVYANALEAEHGVLTGRVVEPVVNGERKAALLGELAHERGLGLQDVIAVGDGANDLPMLGRAGLGVAFRAKPVVRARAACQISAVGLDGVTCLMGAPSELASGAD